jgi:hypothetical protein
LSNDLTAFNPELWRGEMQETFFKESTALGVASVDLRSELSVGDTLHQPYGSYARVQTYTKGTDITVKDVAATDDYLTVDTAKVASFYVDDLDKVQNKYDAMSNFAKGAMSQLNNVIDQAVLNSGKSNAATTLTGASIGEAAGGIVFSPANTANVFTAMGRILDTNKRLRGERFAMIGPRMKETIVNYVGGRETGFGDTVSDNGVVAKRFGFELVLSNNLPWEGALEITAQPSDAETVVINGVTFTWKTTLTGSTTLGEVLIGNDAAAARVNLIKAVNDSGTVDTNYSALSAENRQLIEESGIVATNNIAGTQIDFIGYGDIVVSETMAGASNIWHDTYQYSLSGIKGSVALVAQVAPNVVFRDAQLRLGKYVHPWTLFGVKTFERMKRALVAGKFDTSAWV